MAKKIAFLCIFAGLANALCISPAAAQSTDWTDQYNLARVANSQTAKNTPSTIEIGARNAPAGLTYTIAPPKQGTVVRTSAQERIVYVPREGYVGPDVFLVTVRDAAGRSVVVTRNVTVRDTAVASAVWPAIIGPAAAAPIASVEPIQRVTIEYASGRREVVP